MNPVAGSSDYDYTIFDKNGRRVVKDGKEFPLSEEDWKKAYPEHRNTDCKECTFAEDVSKLFTFLVSREAKEKATEEPKDCGAFTMSDWIGHSHFYLFKCTECGSVGVDYPHGYHGSYWYLRCSNCGYTLDLSSSRYRTIYEDNKGFVPMFLEEVEGWMKKKINQLKTKIIKNQDLES